MNIDGKHERVLCDDHAAGVRDIWQNRRAAFHVSWGRSSDEKKAEDQALLSKLLATFGEPDWEGRRAAMTPPQGSPEWYTMLEDEYEEERVWTDEDAAWEEIERLRWEIDDIEYRGYHAPTVRVTPTMR